MEHGHTSRITISAMAVVRGKIQQTAHPWVLYKGCESSSVAVIGGTCDFFFFFLKSILLCALMLHLI